MAIAVPARRPPARLPPSLSAACHPASVGAPLRSTFALRDRLIEEPALGNGDGRIHVRSRRGARGMQREGRRAFGLVRQPTEIGERSVEPGLDGIGAEACTAARGDAGPVDGEIADGEATAGLAANRSREFRVAGEQPGQPRIAGIEVGRGAARRVKAGSLPANVPSTVASRAPASVAAGKRRQRREVGEADGRARP